jgi:putative toxin-antitoxin system antitoxin component (TIGR02293 family)
MAVAVVEQLEREAARKTIEEVHDTFGLKYVDLASALDVDRRTLLRYRKEKSAPSPKVRERMELLREISHLLEEMFATEEAGLTWLYRPVPLLRRRRPIDLIRRGQLGEVLSVLASLYAGTYS